MSGAVKPFGLSLDVWAYRRRELYSLVVAAFEKLCLLSVLVRGRGRGRPAAHAARR